MEVKEILKFKKNNNLFTVSPNSPLSDAVIMMDQHDVGAVVVMDGEDVVGMLTFREVIEILAKRLTERYVGPTLPILEILVRDAMHTDTPTTHPDMDINELRSLMLTTHSRYVPVMEGKTPVSVISLRDIARAVLEESNFENKLLKAYIKDWPEKTEAS